MVTTEEPQIGGLHESTYFGHTSRQGSAPTPCSLLLVIFRLSLIIHQKCLWTWLFLGCPFFHMFSTLGLWWFRQSHLLIGAFERSCWHVRDTSWFKGVNLNLTQQCFFISDSEDGIQTYFASWSVCSVKAYWVEAWRWYDQVMFSVTMKVTKHMNEWDLISTWKI